MKKKAKRKKSKEKMMSKAQLRENSEAVLSCVVFCYVVLQEEVALLVLQCHHHSHSDHQFELVQFGRKAAEEEK